MFRVALVGGLACVCVGTAYAQQESEGIVVTGQGTMNAPPDLFELAVGVWALDPDVEKARLELSRRSAKVTAIAKTYPLDRAKSFTTGFSIRPQYHGQQFQGHYIHLSMRFALTDLARAEEFVVAVIKAGANSVDSMEYTVRSPEDLWRKAREAAATDALEQARSLAKVLRQKPGAALTIRTVSNQLIAGCAFDERKMLAAAGLAAEDRLNLIPPGNVKVQANVHVRFALQPLAAGE